MAYSPVALGRTAGIPFVEATERPVSPRVPTPLTGAGRRARRRRAGAGVHRFVALAVLAAAAFAAGTVAGARHEPSERRLVASFAAAWERGDYAAMHAMLAEPARRRAPLRRFTRAYRRAAETATVTGVRAGAPRERGDGVVALTVTAATRVWGAVDGRMELAVTGDGEAAG